MSESEKQNPLLRIHLSTQSHAVLWGIVAFIFLALIWAYFAKIDEVTVAEGKVIPSRQVQVIQNLEGGIVKDIAVKEGDIVNQNQILMLIDDKQFDSNYKEGLSQEYALQAKLERLQSEIDNTPFKPSPEVQSKAGVFVKSQEELLESRKKELASFEARRKMYQQEVEMLKTLAETGATSKLELLRAEQRLTSLEKDILSFKSDALKELNETKAALNKTHEANAALKDRLERTTVRSPVRGVVKDIAINTVGGVIKPGMDLMEIVPLDDTLLIEAKVKPKDIGFIHPAQEAMVKISAYDFSIYGGLRGSVEYISADSRVDEKQESYYEIRVRTQRNYLLAKDDKKLQIIPGMVATVDILTGKKSVLDYLLKPIIKAKQSALRER